jgi:hypothetical protein
MTKNSPKDRYSIKMRLLSEQPDEVPLELSPKSPHTEVCVHSYIGTPIPSKRRQYYATFALLFATIALSVFVMYYAYETLLNVRPTLGALLLSPSNTVLVITILSQAVTFSFRQLFATLFEAIRWKFACQRKGVEMMTFLGLNTATSLQGVLYLLYEKGRHQVWCLQRLALPNTRRLIRRVLYPIMIAFVGVLLTGNFVLYLKLTRSRDNV